MKITFYYPCKYEYLHSKAHGPMGLTYLAAHLQKELGITDIKIEVDPQQIIANPPDLVGVSAYTETFPMAIEGAKKIKTQLNIPVIIGGYHISALPQTLPADIFDVGVLGEGEHTLISLIKTYQREGFKPTSLQNIPGIAYYDENQQFRLTPPAPEVQNLDNILLPRRELMQTYWPPTKDTHHWQQAIYTSRGCPFRCTFCVHSIIDKFPRYHSPERVIQELEDIIRHYPHQRSVTIHDDIFVVSKKRLKNLVSMIREAGIHKKLTFVSMIKPSAFDEEICQLLKEMNMGMIAFGLESASEPILKYLKGSGARQKQNQQALELCHKYNIKVCGYFILGSPAETRKDLSKTYWFIHQNIQTLSTMGVFHLTPYPGTRFWHDYQAHQKEPVSIEQMDWNLFDYRKADDPDTFFINQHYSPDFLKKAFDKFYELGSRLIICHHEKEQEIKQYKHYLYSQFSGHCQIKDRVLEVSNLHDSFKELVDYYPFKLQHIKPEKLQNSSSLLEKPVDIIFLNHALEQIINPEELLTFIKNYTHKSTKILISLYNIHFLPFIINLIAKEPANNFFEPLELNSFYHYYSLEKIQHLFRDFEIVNTQPIKQALPQGLEPFQQIFQQIAHKKSLNYDTYSYLISLKRPNL